MRCKSLCSWLFCENLFMLNDVALSVHVMVACAQAMGLASQLLGSLGVCGAREGSLEGCSLGPFWRVRGRRQVF